MSELGVMNSFNHRSSNSSSSKIRPTMMMTSLTISKRRHSRDGVVAVAAVAEVVVEEVVAEEAKEEEGAAEASEKVVFAAEAEAEVEVEAVVVEDQVAATMAVATTITPGPIITVAEDIKTCHREMIRLISGMWEARKCHFSRELPQLS